MSQSNTDGQRGTKGAEAGLSEFNALSFLANQILSTRNVATLVQVKAVTNAGGLSPSGFVDVLPLVNQLDGAGNKTPHGVIHNLPYFRLHGGDNAVILDPQVGDIGLAVFADRDISAVKATKAASNPGSKRRSDFADGLYVGGFLNGTPSQYVQFSTAGIKIHSPVAVVLDAPDVQITAATVEIVASGSVTITTPACTLNAATTINGSLSQGTGASGGGATMLGPIVVAGDVVAGGRSMVSHVHSGVVAGGANTGAPV
jgi:hypothetical protein